MRVLIPLLLSVFCLRCAPGQSPPTPPARAAEAAPPAEVAPPEVAVIGGPNGGTLSVTFRAARPVDLSATEGARLVTPRGTVEAPLAGPPVQSREGDVAVVTGSYVLAGPDVPLANASDRSSTLEVTVGGEPRRFPVLRGDVLE